MVIPGAPRSPIDPHARRAIPIRSHRRGPDRCLRVRRGLIRPQWPRRTPDPGTTRASFYPIRARRTYRSTQSGHGWCVAPLSGELLEPVVQEGGLGRAEGKRGVVGGGEGRVEGEGS
ncbi:hypothetical protein Ahu01nite_048670 [Winogradskya humida]|uniref:Uncharacterized protein n=1 Tax=Winogradskya humida TaxID=113566 RepID=A0ABQ3ZT57_9ACTN|nr:hypothetical protein Ahu01nite_048670 [Actinoplanes humidus]